MAEKSKNWIVPVVTKVNAYISLDSEVTEDEILNLSSDIMFGKNTNNKVVKIEEVETVIGFSAKPFYPNE